MMGWSPRCYIPSFVEVGPMVPEKKIFDVFFSIYGHGGHLGHVTQMWQTNFLFPYTRKLHKKLSFNWQMFEIVNRRMTAGRWTMGVL